MYPGATRDQFGGSDIEGFTLHSGHERNFVWKSELLLQLAYTFLTKLTQVPDCLSYNEFTRFACGKLRMFLLLCVAISYIVAVCRETT
jgi:hypothetical protein